MTTGARVHWVGGVIGLFFVAAACGESTSSEDGNANGGRGGAAGDDSRGGSAGGGTSGGASGRAGAGSGGRATGGTESGGEGGENDSGGAAGDDGTGGTVIGGGSGGRAGNGGSVGGSAAGNGGAPGGAGGMSGAPGGAGGARAGGGGASGQGGSGGAVTGPFVCSMPKVANCGAINSFASSFSASWGSGDFTGGVSVFGAGVTRDMTTSNLHVTGTVAGYGEGFNLWFTSCSTLAAYTGVAFTLTGMTTDATAPNTMIFHIQTNADYPWQVRPADRKGACTAASAVEAFSLCIPPSMPTQLSNLPNLVSWSEMMGGSPTVWHPVMSPFEVVGLQWQFPWSAGRQAYSVDVTLDDVRFIGGTGPKTACPPDTGDTGGVNTDPECMGIAVNGSCTIQGKSCPNMICGLGNSGRRACNCATTWSCTACDFANSWIRDRPANIPACSGVIAGELCANGVDSPSSVCQETTTRYCVCATDPRNPTSPPEWDCDAAPSSWL